MFLGHAWLDAESSKPALLHLRVLICLKLIKEAKAGRVEFRVDQNSEYCMLRLGKLVLRLKLNLRENLNAFLEAIKRNRPDGFDKGCVMYVG